MLKIKTTGLDSLLKKLDTLAKNAEAFDGKHSVAMTEVFPPSFMAKNTKFPSLDSMFSASGFKIDSAEDFAAIPDDEWDKFVRENTHFENWSEMQSAGAADWARRKLGLD